MTLRPTPFSWRRQARPGQRNGLTIFKPRGSLDANCCGNFLQAVEADTGGRHGAVAVDLSRVTSIDPAAARRLFELDQRLAAHHRRLLLLDASPSVGQALQAARKQHA